jgi:hypothetical protein
MTATGECAIHYPRRHPSGWTGGMIRGDAPLSEKVPEDLPGPKD